MVLLTPVAWAQTGSAPEVKVGDLAPDFTLVDQNGKPQSLREYREKGCGFGFLYLGFLGRLNEGDAKRSAAD